VTTVFFFFFFFFFLDFFSIFFLIIQTFLTRIIQIPLNTHTANRAIWTVGITNNDTAGITTSFLGDSHAPNTTNVALITLTSRPTAMVNVTLSLSDNTTAAIQGPSEWWEK
jgi:multisubunit Na+/H+ antiporter MnhC subunit